MVEGIKESFGNDIFENGCVLTADTGYSSEDFVIDFENKTCVCPNGKAMMFMSDTFETPSGPHMRFRAYLKDCRDCPLQKQCMKRDVKKQGRQVLALIDSRRKVSHLDKMKKIIDSEGSKRM